MKFEKGLSFLCVIVIVFLSSLQCTNQVNVEDPQIIKQQAENLMEFFAIADPWGIAAAEYSQKNGFNFNIKCKNCPEKVFNLGEFNGYMIAWVAKAVPCGHEEFKKVKALADEYIKLLSENASSEEVINFMIKTSNDMKQVCSRCHGVVWEKIK